MSIDANLEFKIGILGPSRVGKTSLIATILKEAEKILAGTPTRIVPVGNATRKRIADHNNELQGSLRAGEFHPGALAGTEEPFQFRLQLDPGSGAPAVDFSLLDYPGGWIDDGRRPGERENEWEQCRTWLAESSVLILPIESTVVMEAAASSHKRAVPAILTIFQIEQIVREWAKERKNFPEEPALLLLCPVKCESYFADNGGYRNASGALFAEVKTVYENVLKLATDEAKHLQIVYAPVDTLGCVDLIRTEWSPNKNAPGGFDFSAEYGVRSGATLAPKGAEAVLVALCRHLVKAKAKAESLTVRRTLIEHGDAETKANEDKGLLGNFWMFITRERTRLQDAATRLAGTASDQQHSLVGLTKIIDGLAERDLGPRARVLKTDA